ncbi:MAG: 4-hydroxy-3-methylbut-2-enyl diphosphate reductase, partial [Rickettsiales bacterium]|nr:4-hydroxy-3-methylbut-2-enyl diphosphate reductase [Rickettsiales bacterium]
ERFPGIAGPELRDICYATQNRQNAVRDLARQVELMLVIGSANSSNSNRLRDLADEMGVRAHLIDDAKGLQPQWFNAIGSVGITAGASAPEHLVQGVVAAIGTLRPTVVETMKGDEENTRFKLPAEVTGEKRLRTGS